MCVKKNMGLTIGVMEDRAKRCARIDIDLFLSFACAHLSSDCCCLADSSCRRRTCVRCVLLTLNSLHPLLHDTGIVVVLVIVLPVLLLLHVVRVVSLRCAPNVIQTPLSTLYLARLPHTTCAVARRAITVVGGRNLLQSGCVLLSSSHLLTSLARPHEHRTCCPLISLLLFVTIAWRRSALRTQRS